MCQEKTKYTDHSNDLVVNLYPQIIVVAFNQALLSDGVGQGQMRVGAALFKNKRILCKQCNIYRTHPKLSKYSLYPYLHAESRTLIHFGLQNVANNDMLVVRVTKDNKLTMAKPCKACMHIMQDYGIRNIYYSDWEGNVRQCRYLFMTDGIS